MKTTKWPLKIIWFTNLKTNTYHEYSSQIRLSKLFKVLSFGLFEQYNMFKVYYKF